MNANPERVGVREAKINLSRLLRRVQENHEVILTQRGRPVGRLVPMAIESLPLHERIKRLEDLGVIERQKSRKRRGIPRPIPLPGELAGKFLQEDREDAQR